MKKKKEAEPKQKRTSVAQIKKRLNSQIQIEETELEKMSKCLPSLDSLKYVEQSRAKLNFCKDLLEDIDANKLF